MNRSPDLPDSVAPPMNATPGGANQIDATLALLGSVQPRDGLAQRITARLQTAEPSLSSHSRLNLLPTGRHRWMMATASATIVAAAVTVSSVHRHAAIAPIPALSRPVQQPLRPAASVAVSEHPLQANVVHTPHHRGIRRSARATHGRVPLPHGTMTPLRPAAPSAAH